jgi:hypothetical protein
MGLGEYSFIYAMAYHRQLLAPDTEARLFTGSAANRRVRAELAGMLRRQFEAALATEEVDAAWLSALEAEAAALEDDPERLPWQDGLPEVIETCFGPYRQALDDSYSPATAEFDLLNSTVRNFGLAIEMD